MTPSGGQTRGRSSDPSPRRPDAWALAASGSVLLAARWLQRPSIAVAAILVVLTLLLVLLTWRRYPASWRRRTAFTAAAGLFAIVTLRAHVEASRLARSPEQVVESKSREGAERLVASVAATGDELRRAAQAALAAPTDRNAAFAALAALPTGSEDRAVILAVGGKPFAWSGRLVVPMDSLPGPFGIIATPFYIVLYAVASEGQRLAVGASLLHAERPAARLSRALDQEIAEAVGIEGFAYGGADAAASVPGAVVLRLGGQPMLAARALQASSDVLLGESEARAASRGGVVLATLILLLLATAWRRDSGLAPRLGALFVAFVSVVLVPLSSYSNLTSLFDPTFYVVRSGWRFTANAGALAITSGLVLLALLSALRARALPRSRTQALLLVLLVAGVGPFLLRELARGIQVPGVGISIGLWLAWEVTLFLAAVTLLLIGVAAGRSALGTQRGLPAWVAPVLAATAALSTPLVLEAPARLPPLHPLLWVAAIGALAFTRRARAMVVPAAFVAACGAVTLVWFSTVRDRVQLAVEDVNGLATRDPTGPVLLERFAGMLDPAGAARTRVDALAIFAASDLAGADYPVEIATWAPDGSPIAELRVGRGPGSTAGVNIFAREAQSLRRPILREVPGEPGLHEVLAVPHADGTATTVVLAPRSALVAPDAFGPFLGFPPPPTPEPPYALRLDEPAPLPAATASPRGGAWSREGSELHGDWQLTGAGGLARRIHATVDLTAFDALVTRGGLLVLLDLAMLGAVWSLIVMADGALGRWWRGRRRDLTKSFRVRLSVGLFAAFTIPSGLFGLWSFQRVQADDRQSRDLVVRETLRGIAVSTDSVQLAAAAARFDTPLFLYANGLLVGTSDPLLDALSPVGRLLPPGVARTLAEGDDPTVGRAAAVGPSDVRLGYRAVTDSIGVQFVLATPARLDERLLDRRRNDLAAFLLFALALGGLAALWVSGAASRQLSRPIGELQVGALALARGERPPSLTEDPPVEFGPVFSAFRRMTTDLEESRADLETAERRLAATLRNVASGVIAADDDGRVTFANPRAEAILEHSLASATPIAGALGPPLAEQVTTFLAGEQDEGGFEVERDGRRLQVRVARLARGARRVVVTLDDVTDVARAERVLAWGEMARQVAHEIKNPLTPIRLGMQHLLRARRDGRVDFDEVLEENTARVLAEIDRLDEIARAFSRYGTAPVGDAPATRVDVAAVARDVLRLERLGTDGPVWEATIPDGPLFVAASELELREVLLNLLENARLAHARRVVLAVEARAMGGALLRIADDGDGIAPHLLGRIFEPHFSTRTSGSGLGLAISRRLIEGWGGEIEAESARGRGTTLILRLAPPPST